MFGGAIGEQCVMVTVADGDTSYNLILEASQSVGSSNPVEIYPNTFSILIIDNDTPGIELILLWLL